MLNIKIFNDLNNWNYTLKTKQRLPLGGGKLLILSLNHLFNWFVRMADSFGNKVSQCAYYTPSYLLQIVLEITNITFRMHIGTQAVTVFVYE